MKLIKIAAFMLALGGALQAQTLSLDQAIQGAAQDVQQNLSRNTVVSVINMNTPSECYAFTEDKGGKRRFPQQCAD